MTKLMIRLGCTLLLSGLTIAATGPASEAGTLIKVSFSGTGFSGWFQYDQSEPKTSPGLFVFTGSTLNHEVQYQIGAGTPVVGTGKGCEPYKITTSGNGDKTFELIGTAPNGTTVTIVLPTSVALSQTSLPNTAAFPSPPLANSTFTLSGGTTFTGTITTLTPTSPATTRVFAPAPVSVAEYPVTAPCPVYVCQPRPACCLTGLFTRRSLRLCCR